MIYSYDERKIGSYFGVDLYEKCYDIASEYNETDNFGWGFNTDETVDKVVDADVFLYMADSGTRKKLTALINNVVEQSNIKALYYEMYDYNAELGNAGIAIVCPTGDWQDNTKVTGIVKLRYTKRATE